jgi:single-strand DNA-binding protein
MNKAIIIGNLGADPEIKTFNNGNKVANLRVATSRKYKDRNGQLQEETEWHSVACFGPKADVCEKYLSKGEKVAIEGRIQTRSWDDRNGEKRYSTEIVAMDLQMLSPSGSQGAKKPSGNAASPAQGKANNPPSTPPPATAAGQDDDDLPF